MRLLSLPEASIQPRTSLSKFGGMGYGVSNSAPPPAMESTGGISIAQDTYFDLAMKGSTLKENPTKGMQSFAEGESRTLMYSGLKIRSTSNSLLHTFTFGPFSAVSTAIFGSKY